MTSKKIKKIKEQSEHICKRLPVFEVGDVVSNANGHWEVILAVKEGGYQTLHLTKQRLDPEITINKGSISYQDFKNFEVWRYKVNVKNDY